MNARGEHTLTIRLLKGYKILYKEDPTEFYGACKISKLLNIPEKYCGHNYYDIHNILLEFVKKGDLEQRDGKGFRYNP
ncbi:MAG: hypothetical protein OXM55_00550 [Bdellovibrionales bacterium]|nr:hypothetical protein [Bdellovibrionales bacterium]